jgi:starch synthase
VEANWRFEVKELLYARLFGNSEKTQQAVYQRDVKFDHYLARKLSKNFSPFTLHPSPLFWGFQGSCHASLRAARNSGFYSICELATAHVTAAQKILGEEQKLHPEWADSFDNLLFPSYYQKGLEEEPFLADKVVAASRFTRNTLVEAGLPYEKIYVLPLGFDATNIPYNPDAFPAYLDRPLRLLYAGRITQRKGIKYLLEAVSRFNRTDVEIHIIGYIHGKGAGLKAYKDRYQLHPALSQQELFHAYSQYDALVLPSVFEGFGLVIVEAMAAGLPVITTPNTMGPDIIEEDKNGYIVPIRDVDALEQAIGKLAGKNPEEFHQMRLNARKSALEFTWDKYRERLGVFLEKVKCEK